jgi:hypothetical protein
MPPDPSEPKQPPQQPAQTARPKSMLDRWSYDMFQEPLPYTECDTTYEKAVAFLDGGGVLEDWGCGLGYARKFVKRAKYVGVDGSPSRFNQVTADLRHYISSDADFVLLRHVLEHNEEWPRVLDNALRSAKQKLAIVIFTPFVHRTHTIVMNVNGVPDISFAKSDITARLPAGAYTEETVPTRSQYGEETIFYVTMPSS